MHTNELPSSSPLDDTQTREQVVSPLRELITELRTNVIESRFNFYSCNDEGKTPFQGQAMADLPTPEKSEFGQKDLKQRISEILVAHEWSDGLGPGKTAYGSNFHMGKMRASIRLLDGDAYDPWAIRIEFSGECRNTIDHSATTEEDLKNEMNNHS